MHVFKHPKFYEQYRKRAKACQKEQREAASLKQQAIDETVPHNDIEEASSTKPQASSDKPQAPSDSKNLKQDS